MSSVESKVDDPKLKQEAAEEAIAEVKDKITKVESDDEDEVEDAPESSTAAVTGAAKKKKKSKKNKIKAALTGKGKEEPSKDDIQKAVSGLSKSQISELLSMNPALARELGADGDLTDAKAAEMMKHLNLQDIMTGLASSGKNVKDMAAYKFWQTQPVPKFDDKTEIIKEEPFKIIDPAQVPKEPGPLVPGFEWVTMDLTKEEQLKEVFDLLYGHYVEDDEAMFRFNYSTSFLKW